MIETTIMTRHGSHHLLLAVAFLGMSCIPEDPQVPSGNGGQPAPGGAAGASGTGGGAVVGGAGGRPVDAGRRDVGRSPDAGMRRDAGRPADAGNRLDAGRRQDVGARIDVGARVDGPVARQLSCPEGPFPMPDPGPAQAVCEGFDFNYTYNEGPTWVASQRAFYFTNFVQGAPTRGDIVKYTPGQGCEIFQRDVGCNGLAATPDGALVAACHQSRSVVRFDPVSGEAQTLAAELEGQLLDTPNDLVVHGNGSIYFTNPPFELGNRPRGVGPGVFRIDPEGVLSRVYQGGPPNGIALSPDQRRLYALNGGIWDLDDDGVASNRRAMFTGGDGMAVDCAGNVYARGTIFTAAGQTLGSYGAGTNLAFGGAEGRTLLIVGPGQGVREVPMNLPGLP
jgi:gluconolactonase